MTRQLPSWLDPALYAEHAALAPSSAEQWGHCPGSVRAQQGLRDAERERTRLGNAAHWVVEQILGHHARNPLGTTHCASLEGQQAPNGVVIDEEVTEGAQLMVDSVLGAYNRWHRQGELLIEQRVAMPSIHPTENWGTLDVSLYVPEHKVIYIWDYKHGHKNVEAEGNLQLVDYLAGLKHRYGIDGILDQQTTVVARIVQPFCYHARGPVKEWVFKLSDLRPYWNILADKAAEAMSENPTLTTGKHCTHCKAVGTCAATRNARYNWIELVNEPYAMDEMSGKDLAVERLILADGLAVGKSRLAAIEAELEHRVRNGEKDSGLAIEQGYGREKWTIPPAQVIALCGQLGVDARKEVTKTPKQTREAASKEIRPLLEKVMAGITASPKGGVKLVPADDTRAARAFKQERKDNGHY